MACLVSMHHACSSSSSDYRHGGVAATRFETLWLVNGDDGGVDTSACTHCLPHTVSTCLSSRIALQMYAKIPKTNSSKKHGSRCASASSNSINYLLWLDSVLFSLFRPGISSSLKRLMLNYPMKNSRRSGPTDGNITTFRGEQKVFLMG